MSGSSEEESIKRRYREFMDLMPLTLAIAGLPENNTNRSLTTEQMENRAQSLQNAFKLARQTIRDVLKSS
jgi:hypothetical protein